ncbi:hypothetical protein QLX67_12720 [Balneolaceae bacterium ANBcel3]|nr:hypothetical protein [Balneolaceae bacterium ANBcel3]
MEKNLPYVLLNARKADMVSYVEAHPEVFEELMDLAVSGTDHLSWRAAWLLWSCMEENDHRLQRFIPRILDAIPEKEDSHKRELFLVLLKMELNEQEEGILFDLCVRVWEDTRKKPSVRHGAFRLIIKIARRYPELMDEIGYLTGHPYVETLSAGVKRSVMKLNDSLSA